MTRVFYAFLVLCADIFITSQALVCGRLEFPCDDGLCIDEALWCDSEADCHDGSDEAYCRTVVNATDKDPNRCPGSYFRCHNGPCIPMDGRCNGYPSCEDYSDEKNCDGHTFSHSAPLVTSTDHYSTSEPTTEAPQPHLENATVELIHTETPEPVRFYPADMTPGMLVERDPTTTSKPLTEAAHDEKADEALEYTRHLETTNHFVQFNVSDFDPQRKLARDWLVSQRTGDYDWGEETPRAVIALQMSRVAPYGGQDESDLLMTKQLEIRLSIELTRNQTKEISLTELALYINALVASCKNPRNFHGYDLVSTLRQRVTAAQGNSFVNPLAHLTLCNCNETTYRDYKDAQEKLLKSRPDNKRIDVQALFLLMTSCILKLPMYENSEMSRMLAKPLLKKIYTDGLPGNIYEMALLMQAMNHAKVGGWGISEAMDFILRQQQPSGSFGGILATYYVLPILSGRSLFSLDEHCSNKYRTDLIPIEVLKNTKRNKIEVHYGLFFGDPIEVSQMLKIQIAQGSSFLDVMRLAQEIDTKYRFSIDTEKDIPLVFSIGGRPNDAEKGLYWTLHLGASNNTLYNEKSLIPFKGSVKSLIPSAGDEFVFWMKTIN